jgi:hydroxymethylpyrimidine pyrophosphatase-like HAD family hydrolase
MKKVIVAFDIDGTLRANREERHNTEVEPNTRIVELLKTTARSKNVEVHLWSNRGAEYCKEMRIALGLEKYVKTKNCHKKLWFKQQTELGLSDEEFFRPQIAYDDQQNFDGGVVNIIVREK